MKKINSKVSLVIDLTALCGRMSGIERYGLEVTRRLGQERDIAILSAKGYKNYLKKECSMGGQIIESPFKSRLLTDQIWIPYVRMCNPFLNYFFPIFPPGLMFWIRGKGKVYRVIFDAIPWVLPNTTSKKHRLYFRPLESLAAKRADKIFTISENSGNDLARIFSNAKNKIISIGIGMSTDRFEALRKPNRKLLRQKYGIDGRYILFVGTLEPRKNLVFLVDIFNKLRKELAGLKLVVAGRHGWGAQEVKDRITKYGLEKKVILTGAFDDEDLPNIYKGASVFVYPSLYEGFGIPVIEALASSVPIVISNNSSLREAGGDSPLYMENYIEDEWVDAIKKLMNEKWYDEERIAKGLEHAHSFTWDKVVKNIIKILTEEKELGR